MKKILASFLKKLNKVPFTLVGLITLVASFGFILMYSAAKGSWNPWAIKQIIHFAIFLPMLLIIAVIDLKFWYKGAYLFYYIALLLLILVHLLGVTAMGATRWIDFGIIRLQPSELMKISIIFALARYFHDLQKKEITLKLIILPILMLAIPAFLVIKQPDLGTGLILLMLGTMIFFVAGVKRIFFVAGFTLVCVAMPIIWQFLHDYQKKRILTFINPESDPLGASYNIIQSKIAIGSGGLLGKGFMKGTQNQLEFLPEHQTDFIFTMLCEEWGMIGGIIVLIIYLAIIYYCYFIGLNSKSRFGNILALGVASMFFLHVFINIGMVMSLLPAVGVPLPLLSYGGTIMMTVMIGFGLVISVHIHSKQNISNSLKSLF
jgi:rod shape determining protein RodA